MSKIAEEAALKAWPITMVTVEDSYGNPVPYDAASVNRCIYREGYEQAEKDLALTCEDVAYIVDTFYIVEGSVKEKCEEVLRRFNEYKKLV